MKIFLRTDDDSRSSNDSQQSRAEPTATNAIYLFNARDHSYHKEDAGVRERYIYIHIKTTCYVLSSSFALRPSALDSCKWSPSGQ